MPTEISAVTVRSDGVLLRPWAAADVEQIAEVCADPLIALWNPMNVASAVEWCAARADWRDGSHASWAIVEPTSPELVLGSVSLFHIDADQKCAEIGFWVASAHRRRAVGRRGVQAATTFAFGELALRRVVLFHAVDNVGSCGVARRASCQALAALVGWLRP